MVICIFLQFTSTIAFCSASRVPSSINLKRHLASDSKSKILAQSLGYLDVKLPVIGKIGFFGSANVSFASTCLIHSVCSTVRQSVLRCRLVLLMDLRLNPLRSIQRNLTIRLWLGNFFISVIALVRILQQQLII